MNKARKQLLTALATASIAVLSGSGPLYADDIEIFVAGEDPNAEGGVHPNIMFVIDTSGSMDSMVRTQAEWDPNLSFSGSYSSSRIYWSTSSTPPGPGTERYFDKSRNYCETSKQVLDAGSFYQGQLLAWRSSGKPNKRRWYPLSSTNNNRDVECKADRGEHGQVAGKYYANDGRTGPWSGDPTNEPSWNDTYYLFDGNRLNWEQTDGTLEKQRIQIVQEVVVDLLDALTDVNVGLMRFNNSQGGPVIMEIDDIENNRSAMQTKVNGLSASGWTPLSETYYELHQYFHGEGVVYGDGYEHRSTAGSRVGGVSTSKTYASPVEYACQKNYVIYLSDGLPTEDQGAENAIEGLPNFAKHTGSSQCVNSHNDSDGKCLDELAEYLYKQDINPDLSGDQTITTYTIGFANDIPILQDTAKRGGGKYFKADNSAQLSAALTKIAVEILDDSTTFTAPAVPVNSFNRTQNLSTVYTSLFQPNSSVHWPGNLKRYEFKGGNFLGRDGDNAINQDTGFFTEDAWSFWSKVPDGDSVPLGGAAENLPEWTTRKIFSDLVSNNLAAADNRVVHTNDNVTTELLGAAAVDVEYNGGTMSQREHLIKWMNGLDVFDDNDNNSVTDTRRQIGDPLHVRPIPVLYGGTEDNPDIVIYLATNDGYLHAINSADGRELWSYVPKSQLPRMFKVYDDEVTPIKNYILDGQPVVYTINDDGKPGFSGEEQTIMVFGQRRGGTSYFALDITNKSNPAKLWEIDDTVGGEFEDMGQTWSTPEIGKVDINGTEYHVAIFSGGYDDGQDNDTYRTDTVGNAVYMVDLLTGKKLWSAGPDDSYDLTLPKMEHSIPAPVRAFDSDFDKYIDRIYFGDMGGRVWRIDLIPGKSASNMAQGGMLATLGAADMSSPTAADIRRLYNQIDVAEASTGSQRYYALNIGSGYRAHPLDRDISEEFFSVRDYKPYGVLESDDAVYKNPVTRADLIDITKVLDKELPLNARGWRLSMVQANGEKILGSSLTINGTVLFTSFAPGSVANTCTAAKGTNRLYQVSLQHGRPIRNLDGELIPIPPDDPESLDTSDFSTDLKFGGIGSEVYMIFTVEESFNEDGSLCSGPDCAAKGRGSLCSSFGCPDTNIRQPATRTYWTQQGL